MKRTKRIWWLAAGSSLLQCTFALAAGEAEHGAEDSPSIFTGNLGNVIWTWAIFLLVVFVLGKYAWRPILNGLQKREEFIRDSLEQARRDREDSEQKLKGYTEQLNRAREEASAIVDEARRDAEEVKRTIQDEARKESDAIINRARREVEIARDSAVRELYDLTADLATNAAGKIIKRQLSPADHAELVRESITELGRIREAGTQN